MEQNKKGVIKFSVLILVYILLSALGVFGQMESVLFPIFALPFALFCLKNKVTANMHVIFHLAVSAAIYLMMGSLYCLLVYGVSVVVPAYIILYLYKQKLSLPNMMMYMGLGLSVVVFVFFALMKSVGIDFEIQFAAVLDEINHTFAAAMDQALQINSGMGVSLTDLQEMSVQIKQMIAAGIEALKVFYPAIIVSQVVIASAVTMMILNSIARRKDSSLPSTREVLEFRVSKTAVLLLVVCMMISDFNVQVETSVLVLILNVMCFLMNLLQVAGILAVIALISRTSIKGFVKFIGYIAVISLFLFSPYIVMFFGCLDAIFNYRKVKIVV